MIINLYNSKKKLKSQSDAIPVRFDLFPQFKKRKLQIQITSQNFSQYVEINALPRLLIFEDLWQKGYYLTSGIKFGGDYLAYAGSNSTHFNTFHQHFIKQKGDPFIFHAQFVVLIRQFKSNFSPLQIISFGRLGVVVKKSALFISIDFKTELTPQTATQMLFGVDSKMNKTENENVDKNSLFKIHRFTLEWLGVT